MTQDELIKCGCWFTDTGALVTDDIDLNAFAKLIAEKEREACAKECWKQMGMIPMQAWTVNPYEQCANAIRARGQA